MSQDYSLDDDVNDASEDTDESTEPSSTKVRGRSHEFEEKRRRAERILEQAKIRELLGYDVDYYD